MGDEEPFCEPDTRSNKRGWTWAVTWGARHAQKKIKRCEDYPDTNPGTNKRKISVKQRVKAERSPPLESSGKQVGTTAR